MKLTFAKFRAVFQGLTSRSQGSVASVGNASSFAGLPDAPARSGKGVGFIIAYNLGGSMVTLDVKGEIVDDRGYPE